MYTAAGFVALGGFGAVWSARPPVVDQVQASQEFSGAIVGHALDRDMSSMPSWSQRLPNNFGTLSSAAQPTPVSQQETRLAVLQTTKNDAQLKSKQTKPQPAAVSQSAVSQSDAKPAAANMAATARPDATDAAKDSASKQAALTQAEQDQADIPSLSIDELSNAFDLGSQQLSTGRWTVEDHAANQRVQRTIEVRRGDTLFGVLVDAGVDQSEAQDAVGALSDVFSPRALKVGQEITLNLNNAESADSDDNTPKLVGLSFEPSVTQDVTLKRSESGDFVAAAVDKPLREELSRASGTIDGSLFESAREAGLPVAVTSDMIKTLSYNVDFQRDIHSGDTFEVLYERYENDEGVFAKAGKTLYAAVTLGGKRVPLYYFEHDGDGQFFTSLGESVRKSLLRTPIDGAKITSAFGMRMHPLLGYSRMHKGVDFGAPTGTPIFAAGNGVVVDIGQRNGYGNYVRIKHNGTYSTAYAHCSRFAAGLHKGDRVKQGEVIAYVGATGEATGPHLHYEVLVNNEQVNPANVKMADSDKLTGKELAAFKAQVDKVDSELAKQRRNTFIAETPGGRSLDCAGPDGCEN